MILVFLDTRITRIRNRLQLGVGMYMWYVATVTIQELRGVDGACQGIGLKWIGDCLFETVDAHKEAKHTSWRIWGCFFD